MKFEHRDGSQISQCKTAKATICNNLQEQFSVTH